MKKELEIFENREFARKFDGLKSPRVEVMALANHFLFATVGQGNDIVIEYSDKDFKDKLINDLKRFKLYE